MNQQRSRSLRLFFSLTLIGLVCAILFFRIESHFFSGMKSPSMTYKEFLKSIGSPPLPEKFLSHRKLDKELLQAVKKWTKRKNPPDALTKAIFPKIIHQIWLFSSPPSDAVSSAMESVKARNPTFKYHLWTRKDVENLLKKDFGPHIEHLFLDSISLSDYVAASILSEIGGIVIDPWCECVAPIDSLYSTSASLIIGIEPPKQKVEGGDRRIFCSPALIGSTPKNPLLDIWKQELHYRLGCFSLPLYENWKGQDPYERMVWISCDSVTDLFVDQTKKAIDPSILPVGPTWWCPIRPQELAFFHKRISGEGGHRTLWQKFSETFHVDLPLFSSVESDTVLVHLAGGRLGMTGKDMERFFNMNPYLLDEGANSLFLKKN